MEADHLHTARPDQESYL